MLFDGQDCRSSRAINRGGDESVAAVAARAGHLRPEKTEIKRTGIMNRLEELLLKWHDQSLSKAELAELNAALKDPVCRRELMESFAFDSQLREALHSAQALAQTAASAEEFQTQEVREANVLEERGGVL